MTNVCLMTTSGMRLPLEHAPGSLLRIHRNELHYHPDKPAAVHKPDMLWHVDGQQCSLFRLDSPVRVQFERDGERSRTYGPLSPVFIVQGVIYHQHAEGPIGQLVSNELWEEQSTEEKWTGVVFAEAVDAAEQ